jgi:hypothetical protein
MCFLLPVDSKPTADKCPKINQKLPLKLNNVEFLRYCGAILKMETGRNLSMSGINSGHDNLPTYASKNFYQSPFSKWPPQYRTNSTLFDFTEISYVGRL